VRHQVSTNRIIEGGGTFNTMSVGGLSILSILQKPLIEEGKFFLGGRGETGHKKGDARSDLTEFLNDPLC